jgi:uncharacterized membrane-anchored protein YhcB (DUF1043 family)
MAGVPHGENIWKTIILGILITVAGYLIVHFITDKKDHKKEVKEKKKQMKMFGNRLTITLKVHLKNLKTLPVFLVIIQ